MPRRAMVDRVEALRFTDMCRERVEGPVIRIAHSSLIPSAGAHTQMHAVSLDRHRHQDRHRHRRRQSVLTYLNLNFIT